jgi:hypothetical protein
MRCSACRFLAWSLAGFVLLIVGLVWLLVKRRA